MNVILAEKLKSQLKKLPLSTQKKAYKQFLLLEQDLRHPSLRAKKVSGFKDVWEGRVDLFYRFLFLIDEDTITIFRIGPHDEGLGKK